MFLKKIKKLFKLFFTNINNLVLMVFYMSIICILIMKSYMSLNLGKFTKDNRHNEEAHKNYLWAQQYFKDIKKVKSEYYPIVGFKEKPFSSSTINIDKNGYRISRNNSLNPDVYFLGGSTMIGYGSNDINTIPSIFAELTKDSLTVRNLGNGAHNSTQNLLKIRDQLLNNHKPKYIISYEGVNEINNTLNGINSNLKHAYYYYFKEAIEDKLIYENPLSFKVLFRNYITQIEKFIFICLRELGFIKTKSENDEYSYTDSSIEKSVSLFLENWKILSLISKEKNIKLFLFLQPHITSNNHKSDHLTDLVTYKTFYKKSYKKIIYEIQNNPEYLIIKNNFYDLSKVLDNKKAYFYDYCHLNPEGNYIISKAILKRIFP